MTFVNELTWGNIIVLVGVLVSVGAHIIYTAVKSAQFMATTQTEIKNINIRMTDMNTQITDTRNQMTKLGLDFIEIKTMKDQIVDIEKTCSVCYVKTKVEKFEEWGKEIDRKQENLRAQLPLQLQGIRDEIAAVREDLVKYTNEIKKLNN